MRTRLTQEGKRLILNGALVRDAPLLAIVVKSASAGKAALDFYVADKDGNRIANIGEAIVDAGATVSLTGVVDSFTFTIN